MVESGVELMFDRCLCAPEFLFIALRMHQVHFSKASTFNIFLSDVFFSTHTASQLMDVNTEPCVSTVLHELKLKDTQLPEEHLVLNYLSYYICNFCYTVWEQVISHTVLIILT